VRTELYTFTNSETTVLQQRLYLATFYILIGGTRAVLNVFNEQSSIH